MTAISDFLPKYPNIEKKTDKILNPYGDENFYQSIFQKKEFYMDRLPRIETFPEAKGMLMKHQKLIAKYLSSNTLYDQLLLVHALGSGKTCAAIGAIEKIKRESNKFDGAIIIANGKGLLDNFKQDLMDKCTSGEYIPEDFEELTEETKIRRINKSAGTYYEFKTFDTVAKEIKQNFKNMRNYYSNKIIVIDEVHNIQYKKLMTKEEKKKKREKLKKTGKEEKDDLERYQMFKKILHNITNSKVLLLSGTPMRDGVEEIAAVMNLILPENNQMVVKEAFNNRYINKDKDGSLVVKPEMIGELKNYFKGRVSFISSMKSDVKKEFIGKKIGGLNHLIVKEYWMSKFQTQSYSEAYNLDMNKQKEKLQNGEISEIKSGVWSLSSQAILFVYPDKSYGEKGFNKYIEQTIKKSGNKKPKIVYKLSKEFKELLLGKNNIETLINISEYGVKYGEAIRGIINAYENDQCVFVFNNLVKGSGAILFSLLLELFGYTRSSGKEGVNNKQLRYILMTGEGGGTTSFQQKVKNRFNKKDNIHGKIIQVIIGSTLVSEGFSFSHIQQEYILTPYWNYTQTSQAIARGYRLGSHNDLIASGLKDPIVNITQMVAMPDDNKNENDITSIDLDMYKRSEDKDITIRRMLRVLMESSYDCALAYDRNKIVNGQNGSRDCDYTDCNYNCDGINMSDVINGINQENLDYSTYQLYYIKPQISGIHKKLLKLFKKYDSLTMDTIIEELTPEFTERNIKNALDTIKTLDMNQFDYNMYKTANMKTSVQNIINLIEELFQTNFQLHFNQIKNSIEKIYNNEYKIFEIITSLQIIINENRIIKNKYGFPSYLRENNNIYFLVNNLSVINNVSSEYYTKNPNIIVNKSFDIILNSIYMNNLPIIIGYLCSSTNKQYIRQNLSQMPLNIQEIFIEYALSAQEEKIKHNIETRNIILEYFSAYIQNYLKLDPPMWISTLLETHRCLDINTLIWSDCVPDISNKLTNRYEIEIERLRKHPSGYYGFFDPTSINDKGFSIISLEKERIAIENALKRKKTKNKKTDIPEDESTIDDGRLQNTGLVCKDWKVDKLLKMIIWDMKIDIPDDYQIIVDKQIITSKQDIIDIILKETKILDPDNKRLNNDQLQLYSLNDLRRILHWGASKKNGGVNNKKKLCASIYKWLFDRNQIYEKSKKDTISNNTKNKVKPVKKYTISIIDDNLDKKSTKFKEIQRVIGKLTLESALFYSKPPDPTKPKRFVLKIPGLLILIYDKKKIIGFIDIDEGFIQNISITDSHIKKGNALIAIKTALCTLSENPPVYLTKTQDILKKYYEALGFYVSSVQEDGTTVLLFKC